MSLTNNISLLQLMHVHSTVDFASIRIVKTEEGNFRIIAKLGKGRVILRPNN